MRQPPTTASSPTPAEVAALRAKLDDPVWRLSNLYQIVTKGDDGTDLVIRFKPNRAQRRLAGRLWYRNIILKARQLGMTTFVAILWLDSALFADFPMRCGIIAHDRESAEVIFRDKVKFAYDHLPEWLRAEFPLERDSASELLFAHNQASVRVATSMRSGTIHRLLVSELGKIAARFPDRAREVQTGSIPAVPRSGILVVESTAEGQEGVFYDMVQRAQALNETPGAALTEKDYRFHFFPWWEADEYEIDPEGVPITPEDRKYFERTEAAIGRPLSARKRAWYVATREADFAGEAPLMWQEYPSTPGEAFQVSTEGCYYATQLAATRRAGRIIRGLPILPQPVNTFWDLGRGDMTTYWTHQLAMEQDRFLSYYENSGEDLIHYVMQLQAWAADKRVVFGTHYLPHEADHRRLGMTPDTSRTLREMLEELWPGQRFEIVPRVTNLMAGINATRAAFARAWFDEEGCAQGLRRLANYRKKWNKLLGCWSDEEQSDDNAHGSDAFRQWAQEVDRGNTFRDGPSRHRSKPARRPSGMAA